MDVRRVTHKDDYDVPTHIVLGRSRVDLGICGRVRFLRVFCLFCFGKKALGVCKRTGPELLCNVFHCRADRTNGYIIRRARTGPDLYEAMSVRPSFNILINPAFPLFSSGPSSYFPLPWLFLFLQMSLYSSWASSWLPFTFSVTKSSAHPPKRKLLHFQLRRQMVMATPVILSQR